VCTLFATIFLSVAMPFLMCSAKASYCILYDHIKPGVVVSAFYVAASSLLKAFHGFCHAWLHYNYNLQQFCLFIGNAVCLTLLLVNHKIFSSNSIFVCIIVRYIARTLFHFLVFVEA
jgi:hypothetical protein